MSLPKPLIPALGKKLKRRCLPRWQWAEVRSALRRWKTEEERQLSSHYARIIDRHAPACYDEDPLRLREAYLARFAPGGRADAARHLIRSANGRDGLGWPYPHVGTAMHVRGHFRAPQIAHLPREAPARRPI